MPIMCLNEWTYIVTLFFKSLVWHHSGFSSRTAVTKFHGEPGSTRHTSLATDPATNWVQSCSACIWLCPSYLPFVLLRHLHPLTEVGGRVRLRSALRGDLCVPSIRGQNLANTVSALLHPVHGTLYRYISVRQPSADNSSGLGSKTYLFKRAYIWLLPPRTIEEWTYLLT